MKFLNMLDIPTDKLVGGGEDFGNLSPFRLIDQKTSTSQIVLSIKNFQDNTYFVRECSAISVLNENIVVDETVIDFASTFTNSSIRPRFSGFVYCYTNNTTKNLEVQLLSCNAPEYNKKIVMSTSAYYSQLLIQAYNRRCAVYQVN